MKDPAGEWDARHSWFRADDVFADPAFSEFHPAEKMHALAHGPLHLGTESTFVTFCDDVRHQVADAFFLHLGYASSQEVPHPRTVVKNICAVTRVTMVFPNLVVGPLDIFGKGLHGAAGILLVDGVKVGLL